MTRKSAASYKPAKKEEAPKFDVGKEFDQAKETLKLTVETEHKIVTRADRWLDLARVRKEFFGMECMPRIKVVQEDVQFMKDLYKMVLDEIEGLTFEKLKEDDNYMAKLLPANKSSYGDWEECYRDYLAFNAIRPYGEKLANLHRLIVEAEPTEDGTED